MVVTKLVKSDGREQRRSEEECAGKPNEEVDGAGDAWTRNSL